MSRLAEFRKLEQQLAEQLAELEALKGNSELKKEIEFEEKLRTLLVDYGFSLHDVINLLDPAAAVRKAPPAVTPSNIVRKPRALKVYKNPHNGEIIETKGGNHSRLKAWKSEYGAETVESWLSN
ncbi:histone-like nucleoid-structuring protein, MvaT/MvaU family [Pseudomonas sp. NyZ201]|uniref:histone-like nucleoid-structuring protein, MvaT/MvaU family n=1 Tax=Pseudomonas sp. NyZ201 TaxID=3409857 RepID=UPI003CE843C2